MTLFLPTTPPLFSLMMYFLQSLTIVLCKSISLSRKAFLLDSFVHKRYLYSDARLDDLIANLQSADWHATGNISDTVASWTQHFVDVCNAHIPRRTTRIDPSSKPWYSRHLRYLATFRDRLFRRVKKGGPHSQLMVAYQKVRSLDVAELRASE